MIIFPFNRNCFVLSFKIELIVGWTGQMVLSMVWGSCTGIALECPWNSPETVLDLPWNDLVAAKLVSLELAWYCFTVALKLLRICSETAPELLWNCRVTALERPRMHPVHIWQLQILLIRNCSRTAPNLTSSSGMSVPLLWNGPYYGYNETP